MKTKLEKNEALALLKKYNKEPFHILHGLTAVSYTHLDVYKRQLQDCSTFHSEDVGLGIGYLNARDRAWWLHSWQIVVDRFPVLGEEIVIGTWPYGFKGIYGYRNFTIQDTTGEYLVRADSCWFFYDTKNHRPARVTEDDIRGYGADGARLEMSGVPGKIALPEAFAEGTPIRVELSLIHIFHCG